MMGIVLLAVAFWSLLAAEAAGPPPPPASWSIRRYEVGRTLRYRMDATNQGNHYSLRGDATVQRDGAGHLVESFAWSDVQTDRGPVSLRPASVAFRQAVSLAPEYVNRIPPLDALDPDLIGPVTDLVNFYSDLWLAARMSAELRAPGDHVPFPYGKPVSWADGARVVLGEDAVDFDVTFEGIDTSAGTASLTVRHVPPAMAAIRTSAAWMSVPVAGSPNNWVEVRRLPDGAYDAQVGRETFEDRLTVDLRDGKILRAMLDNPVDAIRRTCTDAALRFCSVSTPLRIQRSVRFQLNG